MGNAVYRIVMIVLLCCFSSYTMAIDNPDAPDYVDSFKRRAFVFEQEIQNTAQTTQEFREAYVAYEAFLDRELNIAYRALKGHLNRAACEALRDSQRKWLVYRDTAFEFIATNWSFENFGSAAVISRGDYRTSIIRGRVLLLLHYLQNY